MGVNGAGKTTTFKMLTGDETISAGEAFLAGDSVTADIKKVYKDRWNDRWYWYWNDKKILDKVYVDTEY